MASSSNIPFPFDKQFPHQHPVHVTAQKLHENINRTLHPNTILRHIQWDFEQHLISLIQVYLVQSCYFYFLKQHPIYEFSLGWLFSRAKQLGKVLDAVDANKETFENAFCRRDIDQQIIDMIKTMQLWLASTHTDQVILPVVQAAKQVPWNLQANTHLKSILLNSQLVSFSSQNIFLSRSLAVLVLGSELYHLIGQHVQYKQAAEKKPDSWSRQMFNYSMQFIQCAYSWLYKIKHHEISLEACLEPMFWSLTTV